MIIKSREAKGKDAGLKAFATVRIAGDEYMDQLLPVGGKEGQPSSLLSSAFSKPCTSGLA